MGIFRQFPYSNFHDMNMDEIIKIVRQLADDWAAYQLEWGNLYEDVSTAFEAFQAEFNAHIAGYDAQFNAHINTYDDTFNSFMDSIDVEAEFNAALNRIINDGTLYNIIRPTVVSTSSAVTQQWLAEHITEPTGVVIDKSLTIDGACADAKATGVQINDLAWYNSKSELLNSANKATYTANGVTFTYVDTECWHAAGAATANAIYNLYNSSSGFIGDVKAGDILNLFISSGNANLKVELFFYVNGAWSAGAVYGSTAQAVVPANATGMILRLNAAGNNVFDQSIFVRVSKIATNQMLGEAAAVIIPNTGIDCKNIIETALASYGCVYICKGITLISGIRMPDNSRITGAGASAELKTLNNEQNGIVVGSNCSIDNITLNGGYSAKPVDDTKTACGISVIGNGTSRPYIYNTKISNCIIKGFARGGIHLYNTGSWYANGASIVNCEIFWCFAGIWIDQDSEFNKISNCIMRECYCGVFNNGGNNTIDNSTLSGNTVGIYFQAGFTEHNNGHGSVTNCLINHSNNNTGFAIIARQLNHGFIFNACQIWYGKVMLENVESIQFTNMIFGGNTPDIDYYNVGMLMLANCAFASQPNLHGSATNMKKSECYLMDGTPV